MSSETLKAVNETRSQELCPALTPEQHWPKDTACEPQHNSLQEGFNHNKEQRFRNRSPLPEHKILNFVLLQSPCRWWSTAGQRCSGFWIPGKRKPSVSWHQVLRAGWEKVEEMSVCLWTVLSW